MSPVWRAGYSTVRWLSSAQMSEPTQSTYTAIAGINPEPGDEIINTPITDMGALTPIIYQTAVPVFADVDPLTYNVTAETIAPKITKRTKAIIVTHLFGNPWKSFLE